MTELINDTCAVLFSGGTDSTLAAVLQLEKFQKISLITFDRFGIAKVENSRVNAQKLIDKYGSDRVDHSIVNFDKVFKEVSYENYFKNFLKHGFMNLSTCGLCKLSMHIEAIRSCQIKGITHVSDGANQDMKMFPAQMKPVIGRIKDLYEEYGIKYTNPVFEYNAPQEGSLVSSENVMLLKSLPKVDVAKEEEKVTAGKILYEKGLAPMPNIKGSVYDRKRQPRCFQFVLFKIFAEKYFLADKSYEEYVASTSDFFSDKITFAKKILGPSKKEEDS